MAGLPEVIANEDELDALLTDPTEEAERALAAVEGNLLILGVAGKMGPTLARLARRAVARRGLGQPATGRPRVSSPEGVAMRPGTGLLSLAELVPALSRRAALP